MKIPWTCDYLTTRYHVQDAGVCTSTVLWVEGLMVAELGEGADLG
jgi:hypothetical protein